MILLLAAVRARLPSLFLSWSRVKSSGVAGGVATVFSSPDSGTFAPDAGGGKAGPSVRTKFGDACIELCVLSRASWK